MRATVMTDDSDDNHNEQASDNEEGEDGYEVNVFSFSDNKLMFFT
jgi:hypothetical protein